MMLRRFSKTTSNSKQIKSHLKVGYRQFSYSVAARKSQNLARDLQSGLSYAESKIAAVKSKNPLWMDWDEHMKFVLVDSDDLDVFSFGTDMKSTKLKLIQSLAIEHYMDQQDHQATSNYLNNLQNTAISVARWNKPHLFQLSGSLKNSAIGVFTQGALVSASKSTTLHFNEIEVGSTLLGGNSYILGRLPAGVGEFISLTGFKLDYYDLINLGLVNKRVEISEDELEEIDTAYSNGSQQYPELSYLNHTHFLKEKINRHFGEEKLQQELTKELTERIKLGQNPKSVLKDLLYKKEISYISNNYEKSNQYQSFSAKLDNLLLDEEICMIENRLKSFELIHLDKIEQRQKHLQGSSQAPPASYRSDGSIVQPGFLTKNLDKLKYIFDRESYEEVLSTLETLASQGDKFSVETLAILLTPESRFQRFELAQILFNQVRQARNQDLVTALNNEYTTALKFFQASSAKQLDLASPVKSLLPVREFYSYLPDAVRYTLNGNPCNDAKISKNFESVYDRYIQLHGIDPFNPVNTLEVVRQEFFERKQLKEYQRQKKADLNHLVYNFRRKREFLQKRAEAIAKFFKASKVNLKSNINHLVAGVFNDALLKNQKLVIDSSRQLGRIIRKKELSHIRETVVNYNMKTDQKPKHNIHPYLQITEISEKLGDRSSVNQNSLKIEDLEQMFDSKAQFTKDHIEEYFNGTLDKFNLVSITKNGTFQQNYSRVFNQTDEYKPDSIVEGFREFFVMNKIVNNKQGTSEDNNKAEWIRKSLNYMKTQLNSVTPQVEERLTKEMDLLYFDQIDTATNKLIPSEAIKKTVDIFTPDLEKIHSNYLESRSQQGKYLPKSDLQKAYLDLNGLIDIDYSINEKLGDYASRYQLSEDTGIQKFLKEQIEYDDFLKTNLGLVFNAQADPYLESICRRLKNKLVAITRSKINDIFKDSNNFGSLIPVIENALGDESDFEFMGQIDGYLNSNIKFEFFRYISSHVMYSFAYSELKTLEKIFNLMNSSEGAVIITNDQIRNTLNQELGLSIKSNSELELFTKFIDQFCVRLGHILNEYEGQLHFQEDLLLVKTNEAEDQITQALFKSRNKKDKFVKYFRQIAQEEEKAQFEQSAKLNPKIKQQKQLLDSVKLLTTEIDASLVSPRKISYFMNQLRRSTATFQAPSYWQLTLAENIISLDRYFKTIVEGEKSGIISQESNSTVREALHSSVDIYSSGEDWVIASLEEYIKDLLMVRKEAEQLLDNQQLFAYDSILNEYLSAENLERIIFEKFDELKFRLNLIREFEEREQILRETDELNNQKIDSVSYLIRNRFRNSQAFQQLKALYLMVDYKNSEFTGFYTDDEKLLDKIALKRLVRECQLPEGEHLAEYEQSLRQEQAKEVEKVEEQISYDPYCHLIIRGVQSVNGAEEKQLKSRIDEYVARLNLYKIQTTEKLNKLIILLKKILPSYLQSSLISQ